MKLTGNTILMTGGGSGIGRALAEALHKEGNTVIVAGRRKSALDEVTAANPGMASAVLDVSDADDVARFAARVVEDYPALNVVVNNAGIMKLEDLHDAPGALADAEAIVTTNLLGPIRLTSALLPHLLKRQDATVVTVSSGLAYLPLAFTPTYCATKAAIHSYSLSLRYQLKDTSVGVVEIVPPYVQTELLGPNQAADPAAMPLAEFVDEVMEMLRTRPDAIEVSVKRVDQLRDAPEAGREGFQKAFEGFNAAMAAANHGR